MSVRSAGCLFPAERRPKPALRTGLRRPTRTPIDENDYQCPFRFTGKLHRLTVELEPIKATLEEILKFKWSTRD
jgi:hypothetical protein